jgi:hypothetical protein
MDYQQIIIGVVVAGLAFLGEQARKWLNARVKPTQVANLAGLAREAVSAAEQFYAGTPTAGADKFVYAEAGLLALAKRLGVKLTNDEATTLIHAALFGQKQEDQTAAAIYDSAYSQAYSDAAEQILAELRDAPAAPAEVVATEAPVEDAA